MARLVLVTADEVARWTEVEAAWIASLAAESVTEPSTPQLDPSAIADLLRRRGIPSEQGGHDIAALDEIGSILRGGGDLEAVCGTLLSLVLRLLSARGGAVFLHDEDAWLRLVVAEGVDANPLPEPLQGVAVWSAAAAEALVLPDPRRVGAPANGSRAARDVLVVPLVVRDRVLGVLGVLRDLDDPPFGDADASFAQVVATELGLVVDRAGVQHSLSVRLELAQQQLKAYAQDMRTAFAAEKERTKELATALEELQSTYRATVEGLAAAVEAKDAYTAGHLGRVAAYATLILRRLQPAAPVDPQFEYGFLLHDIGKLGVPDRVLGKPGPLTEEEWDQMRRHTRIGRRIVDGLPFLRDAADIVEFHHERWDGTGYPAGLTGEEIPFGARVFAVADAFDAMTTDRPYRAAIPVVDALEELRRGAGSHFWPIAVDAFLSVPFAELVAVVETGDSPQAGGDR